MSKHHHSHQRSSRGLFRLLPCADTLGIAASTLCLVHCLVLPALVVAMPSLSPGLVHDDRTHYWLAFFVAAFCVFGVLPGYLQHSRKSVLLMMVFGLSLVLFATFASVFMLGESWEMPLITVGNLLVVAAHYRNRKLLACSH